MYVCMYVGLCREEVLVLLVVVVVSICRVYEKQWCVVQRTVNRCRKSIRESDTGYQFITNIYHQLHQKKKARKQHQ